MIIHSLQVGTPAPVPDKGREVLTAIFKQPVQGPVCLRALNFDGDRQADQVHHGGPDKAVLVYSLDHYPCWAQALGRPLSPGSFGENLTVAGLTEATACVGDIYQVGQAVAQVAQPRIPCFKLNLRTGVPDMVERVIATGFGGIYLRVLQEGPVAPGDPLVLRHRPDGAPPLPMSTGCSTMTRATGRPRRLCWPQTGWPKRYGACSGNGCPNEKQPPDRLVRGLLRQAQTTRRPAGRRPRPHRPEPPGRWRRRQRCRGPGS